MAGRRPGELMVERTATRYKRFTADVVAEDLGFQPRNVRLMLDRLVSKGTLKRVSFSDRVEYYWPEPEGEQNGEHKH